MEQAEVWGKLEWFDILAWSVRGLRSADISTKHSYNLTRNRSIFHRPKRMYPKHNPIVKERIAKILGAGITVSSSSAWSFLVVIALKKNGDRGSGWIIKLWKIVFIPNRWRLPKIEEILED